MGSSRNFVCPTIILVIFADGSKCFRGVNSKNFGMLNKADDIVTTIRVSLIFFIVLMLIARSGYTIAM